jgi:hypothetical protein
MVLRWKEVVFGRNYKDWHKESLCPRARQYKLKTKEKANEKSIISDTGIGTGFWSGSANDGNGG